MTLDELRAEKGTVIRAIAAKHGVTSIRVFGSMARGDSAPGSDLDLLIEPGPVRTPFFPGGLVIELEKELGMRIDVATQRSLHPILRDRVLREAVPF